jgi:multidrug efflux system membrane fusion protein
LRPVEVSRALDGQSVVAKGIQPGEVVVTDGQIRLTPGAKVEMKNPVDQNAKQAQERRQ